MRAEFDSIHIRRWKDPFENNRLRATLFGEAKDGSVWEWYPDPGEWISTGVVSAKFRARLFNRTERVLTIKQAVKLLLDEGIDNSNLGCLATNIRRAQQGMDSMVRNPTAPRQSR